MGHYCRICGCIKANEAFSGRGHRDHICKRCAKLPKQERDAVDQKEEIFGFLRQSHISDRNLSRLKILTASENPEIARLAAIVLEVGSVTPHKRRRLKILARQRRDLLLKLEETDLILAHHW